MSGYKKTTVVDPYALIQSLAHSGGGKQPPGGARGGGGADAGGKPSAPGGVPAGRFGKTIQPTRRTVKCFSCGFECQISGTTAAVYCSRCRERIELGDVTVRGEWSQDVRTGGTVHVMPGAVLKGCKVMAGNVILEGELDARAEVECTQWLELGGEANPNARQLTTRNLRVGRGCRWAPSAKLQLHHVEVLGELEANLEASGVVSVQAGGYLKGSVKGAHLQVEEGGGLSARVFIWPPS
jgi:cytoskeletal protein CcmA (bactofilin family)